MKSTVMKFGGTSVEGATAFKNAATLICDRQSLRPVVVVSAMAGFTDALIESVQQAVTAGASVASASLAKHFDRHYRVVDALLITEAEPMKNFIAGSSSELAQLLQQANIELNDATTSSRARRKFVEDAIVSYGERLSATLLAAVLRENCLTAACVDARQCIITDDDHGCAKPLMPETFRRTREHVQPVIDQGAVPVLGGFIGSTIQGETTTLGRGGSDYTAALIGAALEADEIQIWTDVPGVLTADPRLVPHARTVPQLSFDEAAELAYFGAKVLHPKTLHPAIERDIPVRICNSREQESGSTLVIGESKKSQQTVKAIAHKKEVTTVQVTSTRMLGAYGFLRALFEIFDEHKTAVDVVTTSEVSVSLSLDDTTWLPDIVTELERLGSVSVEEKRAIICVVGEGLRTTPGIAARIFSTISDINVSLISQGASRINLTFAVEQDRVRETVSRLHKEFFENEPTEQALRELNDMRTEVSA